MVDAVPAVVIFDLGGVLVQIVQSLEEACARAGLAAPPARSLVQEIELRRANEAYMAGRLSLADLAQQMSETLGGGLAPKDAERAMRAWIIGEYAGAADLTLELRRRGVRTACLSNTCEEHWVLLQRYAAVAALEQHFVSHRLGGTKPEAAVYAFAERSVGVHGRDILYVDDVPEYVEAAAARGWQAHHISPGADPVGQVRTILAAARLLLA